MTRVSRIAARLAIAAALAGCTIAGGPARPAAPAQPTEDMMPSSVLDHQDPGADTSHNPVLQYVSSGGGLLDGLFSSHRPDPAFGGPAAAPHYYKGCKGCASEGAGGAPAAIAVAAGLGLLGRRRRRA
jgi:MYXO-CTERM domain-containing protein